ncbi:MAG: hypothetical protein AB1638_03405 [Nitrospirota bacterium]
MTKVLLLTLLSFSIIIFGAGSIFSEDTKAFQFKKQPEIQQVKQKKPVRIKLRRLAEGKYTWELTGDDVNEIVRIDRQLRRLLKVE